MWRVCVLGAQGTMSLKASGWMQSLKSVFTTARALKRTGTFSLEASSRGPKKSVTTLQTFKLRDYPHGISSKLYVHICVPFLFLPFSPCPCYPSHMPLGSPVSVGLPFPDSETEKRCCTSNSNSNQTPSHAPPPPFLSYPSRPSQGFRHMNPGFFTF